MAAAPLSEPTNDVPQVVDSTVGGMLVHARRNGGVIFKANGNRHIGTAHLDDRESLTGHMIGGEHEGEEYAPGMAFAGSDRNRQATAGKMPISAAVDVAVIAPVGRQRLDNAHLEIKAPGGAHWRLRVSDDGQIITSLAPSLAAPGKAAPAPRAILAVRSGVAIVTAGKPTLAVV